MLSIIQILECPTSLKVKDEAGYGWHLSHTNQKKMKKILDIDYVVIYLLHVDLWSGQSEFASNFDG